MANGIDSIYDPSDVSRMLVELREQRLQMEEARRKKIEGTARVGSSAWKMWSGEQAAKTKELLATKDYVIDPKYTEKNWLSRSFTPSSKRVIPAEEFGGEVIGSPSAPKEVAAGAEAGVPVKLGLKEAGAGVGAGMSLYETISSWDEHKKNKGIKRGIDVGKTLAYTASAVPGPHQAITAPIAGVLTLADLFI